MACLLLQVVLVTLLMLTGPRAHRVCLSYNSGGGGDKRHLIYECAALVLASLQSRHAGLLTGSSDTMRSFFAQPDHMGAFAHTHIHRSNRHDCHDWHKGSACWLAQA